MPKEKGTAAKNTMLVQAVKKRDGSIAPFDMERIANAIHKAMIQTGEGSPEEARLVANKVFADLVRITKKHKNFVPTVEGIQDSVEKELILSEYVKTAKAYILYREKRAKLREKGFAVPERVKQLALESKKYFRNSLGEFVYYRTYARWIPEENRRETWIETVDRYIGFMKENVGKKLKEREYAELRDGILNHAAMPSMRLLQFSGAAARTTNVCAYNCSYIAPTRLEDFAEIMYVSMCGTGAGWSVESQNIQQLPQIKFQSGKKLAAHAIADSKEGWCDAFTLGLKIWYDGKDIDFDFSQVRPAGERLKTMGGKASGPEPLRRLLQFTRAKILSRQGKRLSNVDAHDIICMIGDCVVAGGVRRSAMISLSDLEDEAIRDAKKGQFYLTDPQRALANNSAVYVRKPAAGQLLDEWVALIKSGSGERGIFNRGGLAETLPARRIELLKKEGYFDEEGKTITGLIGTNPCGEIILQSKQFCNLSEVVARSADTLETLKAKVRLAVILGTYQSTLTKFNYISKEWTENCEQERLLGVSITGQWDCPAVREARVMRRMRAVAIKTNQTYAKRFGVPTSSSITCVKPSGTVSQTFNCSSGIHPRNSQYYIRRVRISATDSLYKMMRDQGVQAFPEVGQNANEATTFVLEFPVKAPAGSVFKNDLSAIQQLEYWKMVKLNFTEHNPSATISVGEEEWVQVVAWLYENWDIIGGLSFLPRADHVYRLSPYEEIDKKTYDQLTARFPQIDYSKLIVYERSDETEQAKELACAGGTCEIV